MKVLAIRFVQIYQVTRIGLDWLCQSVFGVALECKHSPSCSQYTINSIREHGTIRGSFLGLRRILRCW